MQLLAATVRAQPPPVASAPADEQEMAQALSELMATRLQPQGQGDDAKDEEAGAAEGGLMNLHLAHSVLSILMTRMLVGAFNENCLTKRMQMRKSMCFRLFPTTTCLSDAAA